MTSDLRVFPQHGEVVSGDPPELRVDHSAAWYAARLAPAGLLLLAAFVLIATHPGHGFGAWVLSRGGASWGNASWGGAKLALMVGLRRLLPERRPVEVSALPIQLMPSLPPVVTDEQRYGEMFENLTEMIAMVSPQGKYLFVNGAWQRYFGRIGQAVQELPSFASAFPFSVQSEAAALFERALAGERVEQIHLRLEDARGRVREMEASLNYRRERGPRGTVAQPGAFAGGAVRCIFRDVTLRNQRERRLAMQLGVSQVIQEATVAEEALPRLLAALGDHLGFDLVQLWRASGDLQSLRYGTMWMAADCIFAASLTKSATCEFRPGEGLPGMVWLQGTPCWVDDIHQDIRFAQRDAPKQDQLTTCWGVPVRVGNQVIAVIELFSRARQCEDVEMMSTVETVCASIGQFLARSAQEKRVSELNRQKESILNTVADGILGADQHGRVTFANPAAAAMLGTTPNALIGRFVHAIVHEDASGGAAACLPHCRIRRGFFAREGAHGQDIFYRPDHTGFPVEFSVTPMFAQGSPLGTVLNFRDVSQREALDRMKNEFISTVSHELRTPLTSIRGALGLLSTGMLSNMNDKAANLLRIAVNNSDRLVRLINDILDLERMQSGRAPLSFRPCALEELIHQAIDAMAPVAEAAGVSLAAEVAPLRLDADYDRLLQVITNLLSNAIKFSPPQSVVTVRLELSGEDVVFSVADQGRGIPEDKLEAIFDRFQQVDASDSRQKGGTGLGLAICRTIVHQHGGRVWADRNPDRGATFRVSLPASPRREVGITYNPGVAQCGTVLLCEDDSHARLATVQMLKQSGFMVLEAATARDAIALAQRRRVDAILLNLALPDLNGWQALRLLKGEEATASVPILMVGAASSFQGTGELHEADGWISKPIAADELCRELDRVTRGSSARTHLLLLEDDIDLARVLMATFEREGISVSYASTRRAAEQLCAMQTPHLLVLDLSLPDGDGFGFIDWLRDDVALSQMPLVVYSARDVSEEERARLRLGPTEFLTKTRVQPHELESLVRGMLRRPREQDLDPGRRPPASVRPDQGDGRSVWSAAY